MLCEKINQLEIKGIPISNIERYTAKDEYFNERGAFYLQKLGMGSIQYSASLDYPIETPDGSSITPAENNKGKKACWRWSKEKFYSNKEKGFIEIKKDSQGIWTVYTKQYMKCDNEGNQINRTQRPMGIINEFSSTQAAKTLQNMRLGNLFSYSKPVDLLEYLVQRIKLDGEYVLDFFQVQQPLLMQLCSLMPRMADTANLSWCSCLKNTMKRVKRTRLATRISAK